VLGAIAGVTTRLRVGTAVTCPTIRVEDARLYTRPDEPPPLMIAASKPVSARLAARAGDAMINTEIAGLLVERFKSASGERKPRFVEMTVCWAKDERRARGNRPRGLEPRIRTSVCTRSARSRKDSSTSARGRFFRRSPTV